MILFSTKQVFFGEKVNESSFIIYSFHEFLNSLLKGSKFCILLRRILQMILIQGAILPFALIFPKLFWCLLSTKSHVPKDKLRE
jgi:hypothetical protein